MEITAEIIEAVRIIRKAAAERRPTDGLRRAIDTLDNGGLFAPVDQESGHDVDGSDAATRPLQEGDRIRHRTVRDEDGFGLIGTVGPIRATAQARVKWDSGDESLENLASEGHYWDKVA